VFSLATLVAALAYAAPATALAATGEANTTPPATAAAGIATTAGPSADPTTTAAPGTGPGSSGAAPTPNGARVVAPIGGLQHVPIGPVELPPPPDAPGTYPLEPSRYAVIVRWFDRSDDEQTFTVYRRNASGGWQLVHQEPTRDVAGGGDYAWTDTDTSMSGQCYMIAASNGDGSSGSSEECTVRPDPDRFPLSIPASTQQWYGLSNTNDGTGYLQNSARSDGVLLHWSHQTFGVDLDWTDGSSLWRVEAQGGPQLMKGQAVALRVWGGGWLKYGHETWGVDLQLSDTPVYEWYALGGQPGQELTDSSGFALWNSSAKDYLVAGHQTFGVSLNWYQQTLPKPPPPPPPPPAGVKTFVAYNCISEDRPVEMWVEDFSAGTGWVDKGRLDAQWSPEGGCPATGQPWTFSPTPGHAYLVESVDDLAPGCSNDPTIGCDRSDPPFTGDAHGQVVSTTIG
jgi:hypothetical protein